MILKVAINITTLERWESLSINTPFEGDYLTDG